MKTIIVYICLLIMVYGNCYLASTDNLPVYYNHYFNIMPIALFFFLFGKKYAFSIDKKWLLLTGISFLFMTIIWERDKGNSSITLLCFMLIPQFCLKVLPKFKLTSILVFSLLGAEALLCIYEYLIQNNFFYTFEEFGRFRSSGLWGHPLHNASITSVVILLLLLSPIKGTYKILFSTIGFVVLFTFNGRAAIISTGICSILILYINRKETVKFLTHKPIFSIIICIAIFYLLNHISNNDLGGKLFAQETRNFNDGSSMARFYLYEYILQLDFDKWLFGVNDLDDIFKSNDFSYIESTPISLILNRGLVIALPLMIFQYTDIYKYFSKISKSNRYIIILDIIIIGLSSESFMGIAPWVMIYLTYSALFENKKIRTNENRYSNISSLT